MHLLRFIEALQGNETLAVQAQRLTGAQFGNRVRNPNVIGLSMSAQPRCQLHGRSEEVVVTLDRFASGDTNANLKLQIGVRRAMQLQILLNFDATTRGGGCSKERRPN